MMVTNSREKEAHLTSNIRLCLSEMHDHSSVKLALTTMQRL